MSLLKAVYLLLQYLWLRIGNSQMFQKVDSRLCFLFLEARLWLWQWYRFSIIWNTSVSYGMCHFTKAKTCIYECVSRISPKEPLCQMLGRASGFCHSQRLLDYFHGTNGSELTSLWGSKSDFWEMSVRRKVSLTVGNLGNLGSGRVSFHHSTDKLLSELVSRVFCSHLCIKGTPFQVSPFCRGFCSNCLPFWNPRS